MPAARTAAAVPEIMRNNQPVTSHEYRNFPNDYLISRTDLKGRITFANRAFVEVSGYSHEELMGAPQYECAIPTCLPRPLPTCGARSKQAIMARAGQNRRKNGDYYWVNATVTPTRVDGRSHQLHLGACDGGARAESPRPARPMRASAGAAAGWWSVTAPWSAPAWQAGSPACSGPI